MPRILVALLASLAGIAVGVIAGRWTATPKSNQSSAPLDDQARLSSDACATEIRALTREIEELRKDLALRESAPSRIPAGVDDGTARLTESIATLNNRLQSAMQLTASTSLAGERASDRVRATGKSSLAEIDALTDLSMPAMERVSDDWREAHLLWTVPQVIDRYGMPTNVFGGQGQITLEYLRPRPAGPRLLVDFVAYDGFVTQVRVTH